MDVCLIGDMDHACGARVVQEIISAPEHEPIRLVLSSDGGLVSVGWAILGALEAQAATHAVEVLCLHDASSSAAFLLCASPGRRRALPHSLICLHPHCHTIENTPTPDMTRIMERRRAEEAQYFEAVAARSRMDTPALMRLVAEERNVGAHEALGLGLIDEVVGDAR